jgi:hypothetical protein
MAVEAPNYDSAPVITASHVPQVNVDASGSGNGSGSGSGNGNGNPAGNGNGNGAGAKRAVGADSDSSADEKPLVSSELCVWILVQDRQCLLCPCRRTGGSGLLWPVSITLRLWKNGSRLRAGGRSSAQGRNVAAVVGSTACSGVHPRRS